MIITHTFVFHFVPLCPFMSSYVPLCPLVSSYVLSCPLVSSRVLSCPLVSSYVLSCLFLLFSFILYLPCIRFFTSSVKSISSYLLFCMRKSVNKRLWKTSCMSQDEILGESSENFSFFWQDTHLYIQMPKSQILLVRGHP